MRGGAERAFVYRPRPWAPTMLAYNGLALITEKLQNQRLEEAPQTSSCSSKLPQVNHENTTKVACAASQSNLAVKGKNVWALSLESERSVRQHESAVAEEVKLLAPRHSPDKGGLSALSAAASAAAAAVCRHRKPRRLCLLCDTSPGATTLMAPPKKKHCRSLSVPPDDAPSSLPVPGREGPAKIWKPIAVIPLGSSHHHKFQVGDAAVDEGGGTCRSSVHPNPTAESTPGTKWLPKLPPSSSSSLLTTTTTSSSSSSSSSGFVKLVPPPSVPSPLPSVDSGHFTTSDLQTPPGSPVPPPRPASATSDTSSFSSLGSTWLDTSSPMRARIRILENRSLSCEDRISGCSSSSSSSSYSSAAPSSSSPFIAAGSRTSFDPCLCCRSGQCGLGGGGGSGVAPGGGGVIIPRCHSQPCVLHHRRCGKKRRRDCDRPTLNFSKMTETAYTRSHRRSEPWNTSVSDHQMRIPENYNFMDMVCTSGSRSAFSLNPIASSPLDSELPVMSGHLATKPSMLPDGADISQAASVALPLTPPNYNSPSFPHREYGEDWEEEEEEEEEAEDDEDTSHGDCNCHDNRTEDGVGLFPMNDLDLEQIENH